MKLLSVAIPCYNSESYMRHCVDTLLSGGEDVEIIIVNDGSTKDNTLGVARELEKANPSIVKVVDKPNGGHGSAVNFGLKNATGKYFKVVDSDDWVDEAALKRVLETLKKFSDQENEIDLLLCDFMYDKVGKKNKKTVSFKKQFPVEKVCSWADTKKFPLGTNILMHAIIYRTDVLRQCKLELPEHTFYVDNIFAFKPFPYCKKIYYLPVCLYHYFIGRNDQSVNEKVMIGRIDQQIRVNRIMIDEFKNSADFFKEDKKLRRYMFGYLKIISVISSVLCNLSKNKENYQKKQELWDYMKATDPDTYKEIKGSALGKIYSSQNAFMRWFSIRGYMFAKMTTGFN